MQPAQHVLSNRTTMHTIQTEAGSVSFLIHAAYANTLKTPTQIYAVIE